MPHLKPKPTFDEEKLLESKGYKNIAGVDEVGRGCFAGPVVAAAVILPEGFDEKNEVNDSKLLSPKKREVLAEAIRNEAKCYAISEIDVGTINLEGIGKATQIAFLKAVNELKTMADFVLVDAFYIEGLDKKMQKPIIHGDRISKSIAAASILAKVYRDKLMIKYHDAFPQYNFLKNKGYGTGEHRQAIKEFGLSELHRLSFNLYKFL